MNHKNTTFTATKQLPAGIALNDHNIEFVGMKETQTVIWLQHGNSHSFEYLPKKFYRLLLNDFLEDKKAIEVLEKYYEEFPDDEFRERRMVELYTYYMYGGLDKKPDILNGVLQPSENFRHKPNCISLKFGNKTIDINGVVLKPREIRMLDAFAKGVPDKAIAQMLNIKQSTLDSHKRDLFKIMNVNSKPEAVAQAFKHGVCVA